MKVLPEIAFFWRVDRDIREGRFQRWLSLIAGLSSALSGLEVAYEHYRGGYSRRVMYTPVALSGALIAAGIAGFFSRRAAKTLLPAVSAVTLADGLTGFYFHARGIARKPGGWSLPVTNMVMGPPIFAPLLFGVSAYLGLIASFLRRGEDAGSGIIPLPTHRQHWACTFTRKHESIGRLQDVREGRFQRQMVIAAMVATFFSGFEAAYSHYKSNFRYKAQWTPIVIAPMLIAAGACSLKSARVARTWLPAVSGVAMIDGAVGFYYHARGVARRPGGLKKPIYNIIYGPPVFAPLLFAACGFLGVLASLLRRKMKTKIQPGYYPGFRTLGQQKFWDAATREMILDRVNNVPEIRFLNREAATLLAAICARILPQDDRDKASTIPLVPWIDDRLYHDRHDGYRYENMPPDREAYELGMRGIEEMAHHLHGRGFCEIGPREQDELLETLHDAKPPAAHEIWKRLPVHRFWTLLVQDCITVYYSHPWAWDEIGFGGPAYPRAYIRLEHGDPEPWEKAEQRYEWSAPEASISDKFTPMGGDEEHRGGPQGGTH